ncbi:MULTISPECIES: VOC family protein [unclassified Coleofasciculus]|uniref:VOC family protein n=1 Tax=unclassified Coleofasciculus TaxID=2692782 RepID=UPI00187EC18C|nr:MULTISPECIES: VOC family protein [unclassified Coleofasciculus]MBE9126729.1 VOC family protein [Coleofasciculus sp. LEGE 07081]MBE9149046.1 VOC family protein [Coleofasciculus sp. LEGE 07092]
MKLQRFEHINLACQDLDATKTFYQTLFPDWYVRAENNDRHDRWMHFGNDQFYLALNHEPNLKRVHEIYEMIGVNHVGFVIDDGNAMKTRLEEHGIEYYTMTASETKHRIYVTDPDGNEIELVEYHPEYALR